MANVTIKGISDEVYRRLKEQAEANRRSVNREIIHRLERSLAVPPVDPERHIAEIRALHRRAASVPRLTDDLLRRARNEGRP